MPAFPSTLADVATSISTTAVVFILRDRPKLGLVLPGHNLDMGADEACDRTLPAPRYPFAAGTCSIDDGTL
jgi:hypothetical protein